MLVYPPQGQVAWQPGQVVSLQVQASSTPGQLVLGDISSHYDTLEWTTLVTPKELTASLNFSSKQLGSAHLEIEVNDPQGKRSLAGEFNFNQLLLDSIAPLLPDLTKVAGVLSGRGRLEGSLRKPPLVTVK